MSKKNEKKFYDFVNTEEYDKDFEDICNIVVSLLDDDNNNELEEFDNPKEKNRKSYKKRKLHDENIKKQVIEHDGWFRTYELVKLKTSKYPYEKTYVVKWNRNHSGVNKYFKNQSNRAVRRTDRNLNNYTEDCENLYNNNSYRKVYDYTWTID